jgi:hypothetical protein
MSCLPVCSASTLSSDDRERQRIAAEKPAAINGNDPATDHSNHEAPIRVVTWTEAPESN